MHLPYDLTPKLLHLSPLRSPSAGDAAGTCAAGFHPAGPSPQRLHLGPGLQGHHGHHPAAHAHTLRGGMPRGGGFFVWLRGSLLHLFYCRPREPKSGWLKIVRSVAAAHLGVLMVRLCALRRYSNRVVFVQQHRKDELGHCKILFHIDHSIVTCASVFIACLRCSDML